MMAAVEKSLSEAPGQQVVLGDKASCAAELRRLLDGRSVAALFTGRHSAERCGAYPVVAEAAKAASCRLAHFNAIEPEPCIDTVIAMRDFLAAEHPDIVLAVGGGSVLDAAKAAYLMLQSTWMLSEHFGVDKYSSAFPDAGMKRIVAIPTTSGTGSECTAYSNIVDREHAVKKLISEKLIVPDVALVCPEFATSMPRGVTLATGCDALAHLVEGFLNVRADGNHPLANKWALTGIRLIRDNLRTALDAPDDMTARRNMAVAAALGGMVIRYKSTGLPHLCSFSWFGRIEHGIAAILLLPAAWRYYLEEPSVAERTMLLRDVFGGGDPSAVVASFREFLTSLGVPNSLAAYPDITPELLAKTAASGRENAMKLELAPRRVPLDQSREILSAILDEARRG